MRRAILFIALLANVHAYGQNLPPYGSSDSFTRVNKSVSNSLDYGFYEYLPATYSGTGSGVPLIIYLHGVGNSGSGESELPNVLDSGIPRLLDMGNDYDAVIISPQHWSGWWSAAHVKTIHDFALQHYNVDPDRIYITGFSAGGIGVWKFAEAYPNIPAAIVPIASAGTINNGSSLANMPIWAFHNSGDYMVNLSNSITNVDQVANIGNSVSNQYPGTPGDYTMDFSNGSWSALNGTQTPSGRLALTIYDQNNHDAWTEAYDDVKMWNWMLSRRKSDLFLDAGDDVIHIMPPNSYTFNADASYPSGSITSYQWQKVSGPAATLVNPGQEDLQVTNLVEGTYLFSLQVTTNDGLVAEDLITLTTKFENKAPIANAGSDISVVPPAGPVLLDGTASYDPDGNITSYQWRLESAPVLPTVPVKINFGNINQGGDWNNMSGKRFDGDLVTNLKDANGNATEIDIRIINKFDGLSNRGMQNGVYPANVMRSYFWTNNSTARIRVEGLIPGQNYNFIFLGSRNAGGNRSTDYTINGETKSHNAANNTNNTSEFTNIEATPSGDVTIDIRKSSGSSFGYLNALVVEKSTFKVENSDQAMATVSGLSSEGSYEFSLKVTDNEGKTDIDEVVVRVIEDQESIQILTENERIDVNEGSIESVGVKLDNAPSSEITIELSKISGDEDLVASPNQLVFTGANFDQWQFVEISALEDSDTNNGSAKFELSGPDMPSVTLNVNEIDNDLTPSGEGSILIDFGKNTYLSPSPWNNLTGYISGAGISNLIAEDGTQTGYSLTVTDAFASSNVKGEGSPNASTSVLPVGSIDYFYGNVNGLLGKVEPTASIKLSGLPQDLIFDLAVFASRRSSGNNLETECTFVGETTQVAYVDAANNTTDLAIASGLKADTNGEITIKFTVGPNNNNSYQIYYLNAMIVDFATSAGTRKSSIYSDGKIINPIRVSYTNRLLNVKTPSVAEMRIIDMAGRVIVEKQFEKQSLTLLGEVQSGVYLIRVMSQGRFLNQRIVVK